ncbi:uncharacterized protein [Coffea arabica]|uniref:C2H2-type domain-containing protein n=1 Tax=Coffea arabica TaxID=13443 RepID=A0ABM4VHM9_COFAR
MMLKSARAKSKNYEDRHCAASSEEEDLANCLVMLSNESFVQSDKEQENTDKHVEKGTFQCKACKKVFNSHQALGGHRASHKKVKGCYAARFNCSTNLNDQDNDNNYEDAFYQHEEHLAPSENSSEPGLDLDFSPHHDHLPKNTTLSKRKSKAHQCSICQRVFSSGQALGGHKRCHWLTSNLPDNTIIQNLRELQFDSQQLFKKPMLTKPEPLPLDLNFPPLLNNAVDNLHMNSADDPLNYEAPARIFLQLWGNEEADNSTSNNNHQQNYTTKSVVRGSLHDEDESAKEDGYRTEQTAKLSNLKDMNLDGGSSRRLQENLFNLWRCCAVKKAKKKKRKMVRPERHKCKLCSRSFPSGRALGGHMRSHLANLPLPPKTPQKQEASSQLPPQPGGDASTESTTSSDCSLSEEEVVVVQVKECAAEDKGLVYGLRENPKKSFRMVDPQFLDGGSVVVQDRGSETESTRKPTRQRSKRTRRMLVSAAKQEGADEALIKEKKMMKTTESLLELEQPVSSVSDTSPEEDLALCLIMLSRDVWRRTSTTTTTTTTTTTSYDSAEELKLVNSSTKRRHKKQKKIKINNNDSSSDQEGESSEELELPRNGVSRSCSIKNVTVDKKVHECPFCGKVYGSGQALGGHKRSHFLGSSTTLTTTATAATAAESLLLESSSNAAKSQQGTLLMIDLNLPAPMEDEDIDDDHPHESEDFNLHHRRGFCSFRC